MVFAPKPDDKDDQEQQPEAAPPESGSGGMGMSGEDQAAEDQEATPDQEGAGDQDQPEQGQKATPEQEAQYAKFVSNGYHLIYAGGKPSGAVLKKLASGEPEHALATTAVQIFMRLIQSANEHGVKLDYAVELHGGLALFLELAMLAGKAKIHNYSTVERDNAWVLASGYAATAMKQAGMLDPAAFKQEVDEINRAQQDGELDHVFPSLGQVVKEIGPDVEKGLQDKAANTQEPQQQAPTQPMPQRGASGGLM